MGKNRRYAKKNRNDNAKAKVEESSSEAEATASESGETGSGEGELAQQAQLDLELEAQKAEEEAAEAAKLKAEEEAAEAAKLKAEEEAAEAAEEEEEDIYISKEDALNLELSAFNAAAINAVRDANIEALQKNAEANKKIADRQKLEHEKAVSKALNKEELDPIDVDLAFNTKTKLGKLVESTLQAIGISRKDDKDQADKIAEMFIRRQALEKENIRRIKAKRKILEMPIKAIKIKQPNLDENQKRAVRNAHLRLLNM